MLDAAREGRASTVLILGEAGMGKSALLDDLGASAADLCVLRTAGLQAESALAFAALHRLLRPALDRREPLPAPQQRALRVAFGEEEGEQVDSFMVALGTLSLLTELSESSPVLCLVDDLQWLDAASRDALLFVARRLLAEPVSMVLAARLDETRQFDVPDDIPALVLESLGAGAVRSLLQERSGVAVPERTLSELTAATGGNPLALVELRSTLTADQLQGADLIPRDRDLPVTARVERAFLDRCRTLSTPAQSLLLLAAADDSLTLATLRGAGRTMGVGDPAFTEVERSGLLVRSGDVVEVRHPLVRSAIYQAATASERRAVHARLAEVLTADDDRDRQTWHRAWAADGPTDDVAEDLALVGARAENRGGREAAALAYERSAELSVGDAWRAERSYLAARNAYAAGATQRAQALLRIARPIADERTLRASIDRLRGRIEVAVGSAEDAHRIFILAARDVADEDPEQALEMAALAGVLGSHGVHSGTALPPGTLSTRVEPDDSARVRCLRLLLDATDREANDDFGGALTSLRTALRSGMEAEDRDVWANLGNMAMHLGDETVHHSFLTAVLAGARTDGAVMEMLYALHRLSLSQYAAGDWTQVRRSADEAVSLARSIGQPAQAATPLAWLTLLAALQGRPDHDELSEAASDLIASEQLGVMTSFVADVLHWAKGVRAMHGGDAAASAHHFARMHDGVVTRLATVPRIMAAVKANQWDLADEWTSEAERFADASAMRWAQGAASLGRALLSDRDGSTPLFEASLAHYADAHRPYDAACAALAHGEHLRRAGQRVDARAHLKDALEAFQHLGADPMADRAAAELRASGETARKRDPSTLVQLTPTEARIAQLVSQGMSNKEVAEACWISPRTVAFHLRNVFTKTGVTSRGELAHLTLS